MANEKQLILLVEDDELLAQTESLWLKRAGYDCLHVFSGEKAIEAVKTRSVDLILMDIDLKSGFDGTQAAEEILKNYSIPILFLSSHTEKEIVEKTERITSYGYVVKDSSNTVLLTSIKMAFKLHKANQELLNQKKALRLSEEKFSKAFYTSPDAISISRINDGVYLEINEGFTKLLGYTPEEVIGHSFLEINKGIWINKEDYNNFTKRMLNIGSLNNIETKFCAKDGSVCIGLLSVNIIELEGEKCFLIIIKDITDRKKIEESLKNISQLQKLILDNSTIGITFVRNRIQVWANTRMTELFELPMDQIQDVPTLTFYANQEDYEKLRKETYPLLAKGKNAQLEVKMRKGDGSLFWCRLEGKALDSSKPDDGSIWIFEDISERKKNEAALLLEKSLTEAIYNSIPGIIYLYDNKGKLLRWNKQLEMTTGYSSYELSRYNLLNWFKDDKQSIKAIKEGVRKTYKTGFGDAQAELQRKDGTKIPMYFTSSPLYFKGDKFFTGFGIDVTERIMANQKICEAENRYRTLFELSPDGIVIIDPDTTRIVDFNEIAHIQLGYSREEFSKLTISDLDIDETPEETGLHVQQIVQMKHEEFETRHKTKQGEIRNIHVNAQIIEVLGRLVYHCIWRDITDRKLIEKEMQNSYAILEATLESTVDGILVVDCNGKVLRYNKKFVSLWRLPDDLLATKDDYKIIAFVSNQLIEPEKFLSKIKELFNQLETANYDIYEFKDGRVFEHYSQPELINGRPIGRVLSFHDVTEQKKAELLIKKSEANLKAMVENINESIWSVDTKYRYIDFNNIFANIVNKAFNVILKKGNGVLETLPEGIREFWRFKYDIALSGQRTSYEYSLKLENELNYFEVYLNPIITDNKITGVSAVGINITERKKVETELEKYRLHLEELIQERTHELENVNALLKGDNIKIKDAEEKVNIALAKEKELGELKSLFVSTASHEFRTPLTTILASIDLLEMYGRQWPETKYYEFIKTIQNTVVSMTDLINDVLTYSKSEIGKIGFNPSLVDLFKLCSEIFDNSKLTAPLNIKFNLIYKPKKKPFILDSKLISQILSNLLSNAVKYSPEGGNVTLEVNIRDKKLYISVKDEGIGIPSEDQSKLFEPFNRAQNIRSIPGSGLGLSIAKKSANIHNGEIILKSILNKGTTVTLIIDAK